jgi:hypothetical protein
VYESKTKIIPAKKLEELRAESREIDVDVVFEDDESDDEAPATFEPMEPKASGNTTATETVEASKVFEGAAPDHEDDTEREESFASFSRPTPPPKLSSPSFESNSPRTSHPSFSSIGPVAAIPPTAPTAIPRPSPPRPATNSPPTPAKKG